MMNPETNTATNAATTNVEKPLRTVTIIWLAFFGSFSLFVLLSEMTKPTDFDGETGNPSIAYVFLLVGIAAVLASFVIKRILLSKAVAARSLPPVQTAYIVAFVMCEWCYLCGFVMRFLVVTNLHYILFVVGALGLALHKPRRDDFVNAVFGQSV